MSEPHADGASQRAGRAGGRSRAPAARPWLHRSHAPLAEIPDLDAFARVFAEFHAEPCVAWHEGEATYLAGGCLANWDLPAPGAFAGVAALSAELRERVVVDPGEAALLAELPLLWHGFAFACNLPGAKVGDDAWSGWPGAELRLPAWLLYRQGERAGLVFHRWAETEPEAVHQALNERIQGCLSGAPLERQPAEATFATAPEEEERFLSRSARLRDALARGEGRKVVLSRRQSARAARPFDAARTWRALADEPGVRAFAWGRAQSGVLLGASPELLVALTPREVLSEALAGTAPLAEGEALLEDPKNLAEHRLVVDALRAALSKRCEAVHQEPLGLRRLRRIAHLHTAFSAPRRPDHELLDLAKDLHPTPALGGDPRPFAAPWLREEERGWFGAPLGYVAGAGSGALLVTIRSALLREERAELFAGAGIVAESDPAAEWRETELKLRAAAAALEVRP